MHFQTNKWLSLLQKHKRANIFKIVFHVHMYREGLAFDF